MKQIKDIKELKEIAKDEYIDCFIKLNGGIRYSKDIQFAEGKFYVFNSIDGTDDELTEEQLFDIDYSDVGDALNKGALFRY